MVAKFLIRLCEKTKENLIEWESEGGGVILLNDKYREMRLVTEESEDKVIFHPQHLNPDYKWILTDDILVCKNIDANKGLAIIPYTDVEKQQFQGYDFILLFGLMKMGIIGRRHSTPLMTHLESLKNMLPNCIRAFRRRNLMQRLCQQFEALLPTI